MSRSSLKFAAVFPNLIAALIAALMGVMSRGEKHIRDNDTHFSLYPYSGERVSLMNKMFTQCDHIGGLAWL